MEESLRAAVSEFVRILRPKGRLLFSVYHPAMAAAGIEANFDLGGVEYRLGAVNYSVRDYLDIVSWEPFAEIAFAEFKGDGKLADQFPAAKKFIGLPMLLVIVATTRDYLC
jgi:hypothetical protein